MNTVKVRNLELGAGIPAICIPNVGKTKDEILSLTREYKEMHMDLMEWRADWFEGADDIPGVIEVIEELRDILSDTPLLFTFRTLREGGARKIAAEAYASLIRSAAATGLTDLIDVEIFTGDAVAADLIAYIHENHTKVVASNQDFDKTPPQSDIVYRLRKMQDMGADIAKIAVMPQSKRDVLALLEATEEMSRHSNKTPIVTVSMGKEGVISRLCGEAFGSAITFGSAEKASAPGQMHAEDVKTVLEILHKSS